jgi:DNA-binding ferritin-like protein
MDELEAADPVAHHLTIDILEGLEKHQWMRTAQTR